MGDFFEKKQNFFYEDISSYLIQGDSLKLLSKMNPECIDMVFADPPYFLSNNGITCKSGRMVSVNKGEWDRLGNNSTSIEAKHRFNRKWIKLCKRVLKPNGSIWISGTLHNIYSIGMALEQEGFKIINNITHHLILPVDVLPILPRLYYGRKKQIRKRIIILTMS